MNDLKPCPFCGGEALLWLSCGENGEWDSYSDICDVMCENCRASTGSYVSQHKEEAMDKAIKAWNNREGSE